jgi:L-aminopeptidase/D-esterase-like protein
MIWKDTLIDIPGIRVGNAQDYNAQTGCTVVLCEGGAVGGVDQRGGAPGTRETDALYPMHLVQEVHALVLSGGSAFGLDSASGVVRYLEERRVGFDVRVAKVPIVPAAILFDLGIGDPNIRPDAQMGYQACLNAEQRSKEPPPQGNVGAGTGATVGKILGMDHATKSGIGAASVEIGEDLVVGALAAVNAFGDVIDPESGHILAGARLPGGKPGEFADTLEMMASMPDHFLPGFGSGEHTVIGVVATNARLNKEQANKVAQMAHDGLARCIRPAHTMLDGDTIFALVTGDIPAGVNIVGAFGAEVFARAIVNAVRHAGPAGGLPAVGSLNQTPSEQG